MELSGPADSPITATTEVSGIGQLAGRLAGKRCFIIGNGPSIRQTDLTLLRGEYTIGLNRIYLNYENMGFEPTFYCAVNLNVLEQFGREIDAINSIKFVNGLGVDHLRVSRNTFAMNSLDSGPRIGFERDLRPLNWWEGGTVTYCAMQVAYYLGFETVALVGVDHHFAVAGEPNKRVTADAPDVNHFSPAYFGKGVKWDYPDLERSEAAYRVARGVYGQSGRRIVDATVNGKLQVYPKVQYSSFVRERHNPAGTLERFARIGSSWVRSIAGKTG